MVTSSAVVGSSAISSSGSHESAIAIITLWRMPEGTKLATYPAPEQTGVDPGTSFAANADLSVAAYGMARGRIGVLDLRSGKQLWTAVTSTEYVLSLAFSPNGKILASGAGFAGSHIDLWEVATGKPVGKLRGHGSWVSSSVFWPDGQKLASSSADQTTRIWDLATQRCLRVLRGHRQEVAVRPGQREQSIRQRCCQMPERWLAAPRTAQLAFGTPLSTSRTRLASSSRRES